MLQSTAVIEYATFNEAWEAATATREAYAAFQGMEFKKSLIRNAQRWFVDAENELYYVTVVDDGLRVVHKAEVHSCLHSGPLIGYNISSTYIERLPISIPKAGRKVAIIISKEAENVAFN